MLSQIELRKIREITKEFFEKMTFEVEVEILPQKDLTLPINLKTEEPQILIGEGGQTLTEIQRLLKVIFKKVLQRGKDEELEKETFFIDLDINNYKKKKYEYLKELAKSTADEVSLTKKEKTLSPMPAYERRVVHLELAGRSDVTTESIGEEPERKIVIKARP